jgi:hypothetical protein
MSGSRLPDLYLRGIGAWATGMPDWPHMRAVARGSAEPLADAPRRPAPDLLAANERRRAPDSVLLALQVAQAACIDAKADPAHLPSVFSSTHGDLTITDAICQTLAEAPRELSPTRFHNSVHNAAAGYWTIGCGCHAAATAISAYRASFSQGLLEAAMQIGAGAKSVLLVAYDNHAAGPLVAVSGSSGLLGLALVLGADDSAGGLRMQLELCTEDAPPSAGGRLFAQIGGNAMAPALVLAEALALDLPHCVLDAGPELSLQLTFDPAAPTTPP